MSGHAESHGGGGVNSGTGVEEVTEHSAAVTGILGLIIMIIPMLILGTMGIGSYEAVESHGH